MPRAFLCSGVVFLVVALGATAEDKNKDKKENKDHKQATITKVDAKKGTITLKMKDKNGKEVEKMFTLAEDVRMLDDTGKIVAIDVFESGNEVLVIEREGKIHEVKKHKHTDKDKDKNSKPNKE
jgi:hypothetical protein